MTTIDVLDQGFVRLVDHMGSDLTVVNAARVSFSKESSWDMELIEEVDIESRTITEYLGNPTLKEADAKLIKYLATHNHFTPFAHPQIQLHIKLPIFVARQWMRSNVGVVYNEMSRRYVDDEPEFYFPDKWRKRPEGSVKQGSGDDLEEPYLDITLSEFSEDVTYLYNKYLELDVAPEMARMILPQNTYTEFWMTASLAAAARMFSLRVDSHAQWEIQQFAHALGDIVEPLFPASWKALTDGTD